MKDKVIVIVGPTASGKTGLSIELAKRIGGEIISADSMQIYKDMDIGTAKVTDEEKDGIEHYLIDIISPEERYTVSNFKKDAENAIKDIIAKGKVPIIAGGTGLYVNSLIYGIEYQEMEYDEDYRNSLMEQAETEEGLKKLYDEACRIDPEAMKKIFPSDKKRIVRVLEIFKATGKTKTEQEILSRAGGVKYDYKVFGIMRDREELYERINLRVDLMIEQGLVDEVKSIYEKYKKFPTAMQGLGYKEVIWYLENKISYGEMVDLIKKETRRYAKRQMTWFRKTENIKWIDGAESADKNIEIILKELGE